MRPTKVNCMRSRLPTRAATPTPRWSPMPTESAGRPCATSSPLYSASSRRMGQRRVHGIVALPGVGLQCAEERQDAVSDEGRDVAPVACDRAAHALEVAVQDAHQHVGLRVFGERREAHQVREECGHLLALAVFGDALGHDPLDDLLGSKAVRTRPVGARDPATSPRGRRAAPPPGRGCATRRRRSRRSARRAPPRRSRRETSSDVQRQRDAADHVRERRHAHRLEQLDLGELLAQRAAEPLHGCRLIPDGLAHVGQDARLAGVEHR